MMQMGLKAVLAPSFGEINNCFQKRHAAGRFCPQLNSGDCF